MTGRMPTPAEFYAERAAMDSHEALGWDTREYQQLNFTKLIALVTCAAGPLKGLVVHDAGCGHADLLPHLIRHGVSEYIGTDFMPEALARAGDRAMQERMTQPDCPAVYLRRTDLLRDRQPLPEADVSFLAGTLAYHSPDDAEAILERVWARTRRAIAFHSWWGMTREYAAYRMVRETQRRVESFLRRRGRKSERLFDYGPKFEALFALSR